MSVVLIFTVQHNFPFKHIDIIMIIVQDVIIVETILTILNNLLNTFL